MNTFIGSFQKMTINGMYSKITVNREATYRQGGSLSSYGNPGEKSSKPIQARPTRNFQKIHRSSKQKANQNTYLTGEGMKIKVPLEAMKREA